MRTIVSFNENWDFRKNTSDIGTEKTEVVNLPHTWNAKDGQDGGNDYFRGKCLYRKSFKKSELPSSDCYYLEINGANSSADVYLNGKKLCHHDGGYSTFRVNLTEALRDENILAIIVDNSKNDAVYPQMADFTFYGGLYRSVNVIALPKTHLSLDYFGADGVKITPVLRGRDAVVEIEAYTTDQEESDLIKYTLRDKDGIVVATAVTREQKVSLTIENARLWQGRRDPYLYSATVEIIRTGEAIDSVFVKFGCRSFVIDADRGFFLNGEEYALRGVSRHQDRLGIGNALLPEHHKEDIELILELGATTVRLAHYQHDRYFYELCDEVGLVVWAEIPYISKHLECGSENAENQLRELIAQCYNHPSIVVWGLSNEITMHGDKNPDLIENHRRLNSIAHEMDKTRLTAIACVSTCPMDAEYIKIPDVVSYNHYFGWYGGDTSMNGPWFDRFHAKHPTIPIGVSEYGCEALNYHTSTPVQGDYTEEYQAFYHEELIKQLFSRKYLWATHVWNMFDFGADARCEGGENGQNHKGLVTMDRKYKKDAFYAYKAWLSHEPFVHICGKRYIDRAEDKTRVTVYSNLPELELFANGVSLGKKRAEDHFFYYDVEISGETKLMAVAGECSDTSLIRKVDSPNESYILREKGAVLNWFDISTPEGRFSLNDKIEDISSTQEGAAWLRGFMKKIREKSQSGAFATSGGFELSGGMEQMLGAFSVLRLSGMLGMMDVSFTKEELLRMNDELNLIKKE